MTSMMASFDVVSMALHRDTEWEVVQYDATTMMLRMPAVWTIASKTRCDECGGE